MPRPALAIVFLAALLGLTAAHAADPSAGQAVFQSQCGACHAVKPGLNLVGPSLSGVVGRHSGSVEGFRYSAANKAADITWTEPVLDDYLAAPRDMVPGTTMSYPGLFDDAKRANLVAYLATLR